MAKAFISYSHKDDRKREILEVLLKDNEIIPIVVASQDEPVKLLSQKVKDALVQADYLIPIITNGSINTQWLNQEIGFAQKLSDDDKIEIVPIIEDKLLNILKGFIHSQTDLPYRFKSNSNIEFENTDFKDQCLKLIAYLKSRPEKSKSEIILESELRNLYVHGYQPEPHLNSIFEYQIILYSSLTIENKGKRGVVIKDIEFSFPYEHFNIKNQHKDTITFVSESYENPEYRSNDYDPDFGMISDPLILRIADLIHIKKFLFEPKEPILIDKSVNFDDLMTSFKKEIQKLNSVEAKYFFQNGKTSNGVISINQ